MFEYVRRVRQAHFGIRAYSDSDPVASDQSKQHQAETGHGNLGRQCLRLSRRSYHLRRWRLAGGECGGQRIASGKCGSDAQGRRRPALRLGFQAAQDYAFHSGIEIGQQCGRIRRRGHLRADVHDLAQRVSLERAFVGEDFVEHQTERINVALTSDLFARKLLGSHVRRSSKTDLLLRNEFGDLGKTKVHDHYFAFAVQHDVRGL